VALPYICARLGIAIPRVTYRLLPDGQPYVDPQKDAEAAITAIEGGLSTYEAEIAKRGGDYRQIWRQKAKENEEKAALGLVSTPVSQAENGHEMEDEEAEIEDETGENEAISEDDDEDGELEAVAEGS